MSRKPTWRARSGGAARFQYLDRDRTSRRQQLGGQKGFLERVRQAQAVEKQTAPVAESPSLRRRVMAAPGRPGERAMAPGGAAAAAGAQSRDFAFGADMDTRVQGFEMQRPESFTHGDDGGISAIQVDPTKAASELRECLRNPIGKLPEEDYAGYIDAVFGETVKKAPTPVDRARDVGGVQAASRLADQAVDAEQAGDIKAAVDLYTQAAELLLEEVKQEGITHHLKMSIKRQLHSYISRGEALQNNPALASQGDSMCLGLMLRVQLVCANGLYGKDRTAKSDPYFTLQLIKKGEKRLRDQDKKNPSQQAVPHSSLKKQTLDPEWHDEWFEFKLPRNFDDFELNIDGWDDDSNQDFGIMDVASAHGAQRLLMDQIQFLAHNVSDDFLGCLTIPLETLSADPFTKAFELEKRSKRSHISGTVTLRFEFSTAPDVPAILPRIIKRQAFFFQKFAEYDAREESADPNVMWEGELSRPARVLLIQHALQHDISVIDQALVEYLGIVAYHLKHVMGYPKILQVYQHVVSLQRGGLVLAPESESQFHVATDALIRRTVQLFSRLFEMFKPTQKGLDSLNFVVDFLLTLSRDEEDFNLGGRVRAAFAEMFVSRFKKLEAKSRPAEAFAGHDIVQTILLTRALKEDFRAMHVFMKSLLKLDGFNVKEECIDVIDDLLSKRSKDCLEIWKPQDSSEEVSTTIFELYFALDSFVEDGLKFVSEEQLGRLKIDDHYDWFEPFVVHWIAMCKQNGYEWIDNAIAVDSGKPLENAQYSTSIVDTFHVFADIWDFWVKLDWPHTDMRPQLVGFIGESICSCAAYYATRLRTSAEERNLLGAAVRKISRKKKDAPDTYVVSEPLCIIMNNIHETVQQLHDAFGMLQDDSPGENKPLAASNDGLLTSADIDASNLTPATIAIFKESQSNIHHELRLVKQRACGQMETDVEAILVHTLFHTPEGSDDDLPTPDDITAATAPILDHFDANLNVLGSHVVEPVFRSLLEDLWATFLVGFRRVCAPTNHKERHALSERQCTIVAKLLPMAFDFFHQGGQGLTVEQLESPSYKAAVQLTKMLIGCTTQELIDAYYVRQAMDKAKEEQSVPIRGVLTVEVSLRPARQGGYTVLLKVIEAKGLTSTDRGGASDPYVMIEMYPTPPDFPAPKTKMLRKTLDPVWNESFELHIDNHPHEAVLRLQVRDSDFMATDDYNGDCILRLKAIGGDPRVLRLPIRHTPATGLAMDIVTLLNNRALKDDAAKLFVKKLKKETP